MDTLVRSERSDGSVECTWYDESGKKIKHNISDYKWIYESARSLDDVYGHMASAKLHNAKIIDDFEGEHPEELEA